jgi:hypothetical protein
MALGNRTLHRLTAALLLALVISPVTAPFSTCDLLDFFGGSAAPRGAILQCKLTPDEPPAQAIAGARPPVVAARSDCPVRTVPRDLPGRPLLDTPLRI